MSQRPLSGLRLSRSALTRRQTLKLAACASATALLACTPSTRETLPPMQTFNPVDFGAAGDGATLDTAALQKAIDAAAGAATINRPARVFVPGKRRYLVGTITLKSNIDFHLADDAELLVSINRSDYSGQAAIVAREVQNLRISGTGTINGRSPEIMKEFDAANEWYYPIPPWRPRLVVLTACENLQISGITMKHAPQWTLHLVGCKKVLIDGIRIRNQLDVPNCDGIDPDGCQDVEIKNADIVCGDDAIVLKSTREGATYGPCRNIHVHDCVLQTQDAGLKIGTETVGDIGDVLFETCEIKSSCRGLGIQLRDAGSISNVTFRNIRFKSQYHSPPWWGRGEALSLTAIPRTAGSPIGTLRDIRFENITGLAENSARVSGSPQSRIRNITFANVALTLDRWTKYDGGVYDNRPTRAQPDLPKHETAGFFLEHADHVTLRNCSVHWGRSIPNYFGHALEAVDVTELSNTGFQGQSAHPDKLLPVSIT